MWPSRFKSITLVLESRILIQKSNSSKLCRCPPISRDYFTSNILSWRPFNLRGWWAAHSGQDRASLKQWRVGVHRWSSLTIPRARTTSILLATRSCVSLWWKSRGLHRIWTFFVDWVACCVCPFPALNAAPTLMKSPERNKETFLTSEYSRLHQNTHLFWRCIG